MASAKSVTPRFLIAACHSALACTICSHSKNSSMVMGGWTPGTSFHETTVRRVIDTTTSWVIRARRSRIITNAWRSRGSPSRNASTAALSGSCRNTRTKSTSLPSRSDARTVPTAARISSGVRGSSG